MLQEWFEEKFKLGKNGDFFLIITYLFAEIVLKNKKYKAVVK